MIPLVLADEDELHARLPYHVIKYGSENIRQNAIIALGNMKDAAAIPVLKRGLHTLSAYHRSLCAWALGELGAKEELLEAKPLETDSRVLLEIAAALQKAGGII